MDLFFRKGLALRHHHQTAVWTFRDEGLKESVAEIFIRGDGRLYFLRQRFAGELPDAATLYYAAYRRGTLSPRPFVLGMPVDDSMLYCALACVESCCRAWSFDPVALIREADPTSNLTASHLLEIKRHARWERLIIPGTWDSPAVQALADALSALDCRALAARLLARTIERRGY